MWNDFPKSAVNLIINKTTNTPSIAEDSDDAKETSNEVSIYLCATYYDDKDCSLIKPCICRIKLNWIKDQSITFRDLYDTIKIEFFSNT